METNSIDGEMELPQGFRFHPTDEELITHYLSNKVIESNFSPVAIGEVDMNKVEPWELPWKANLGENEWYFFCLKDKKYPTGLRTNRATPSGYWKATGKDKEIFRGKALVGMKKTLVFYMGRAPKGEKSSWVCHEYRLEGRLSPQNLPQQSKNDWVISRVFQKTPGGKKVHISRLALMKKMNHPHAGNETPKLPPLTNPSPPGGEPESSHVHCFSNDKIEDNDDFVACLNNPLDSFLTCPGFPYGQFAAGFQPGIRFQFPGSGPLQDSSILRSFLADYGQDLNQRLRNNGGIDIVSTENSLAVSNGKKPLEKDENPAAGHLQDLDCIWNY